MITMIWLFWRYGDHSITGSELEDLKLFDHDNTQALLRAV